jgi:hypothetical protein
MALSADKTRTRFGEPTHYPKGHPVAASTTIYMGSIVMANAGGYAVVGATATGQFALGVARKKVVGNGTNGGATVEYECGDFEFESGTAGDALTIANVGDQVFLQDDDTAAATNGGSTRSALGTMVGVSANGKPIVRVGLGLS